VAGLMGREITVSDGAVPLGSHPGTGYFVMRPTFKRSVLYF